MRAEQLRRTYAWYAPYYDRLFGAVFQQGRRVSAKRLDPQPGERILEVGVGTGLMLPLYPDHCHVTGIDFSGEMLAEAQARVARERLSNVELRQMDATAMDFPDHSFDAVIAAYVVTAVSDHRAVLREIVRVCKPGGRVILTNHFRNGNALFGLLERGFSRMFARAGFRTDLTIADAIDGVGLHPMSVERVNVLGLWQLVQCTTHNGNGSAGRRTQGAERSRAGAETKRSEDGGGTQRKGRAVR